MGDVVNLNKYRKRQQRLAEGKLAADNRAKFARSKTEIAQTRADADRERKELDDKRLD